MNKHQIKSNKTKKKLCDTYLELLKEKEIERITIKEITSRSGYNRGTFYIYYRDVYDMHNKIKRKFTSRRYYFSRNWNWNLYNIWTDERINKKI